MARLAAVLALLLVMLPSAVAAEPVTLAGITFVDNRDGVEIITGWGNGDIDDPFVIVEEITDEGPAILEIHGLDHDFGNRIRTQHSTGFALIKVVLNRTPNAWLLFDMELRESIVRHSPYEDGLSFGQAARPPAPLHADLFKVARQIDEPFDGVSFYDGVVQPGETVTISVVITDYTPRSRFYLMQRRDAPIAAAPPGGTAATLVAGSFQPASARLAAIFGSGPGSPPAPAMASRPR